MSDSEPPKFSPEHRAHAERHVNEWIASAPGEEVQKAVAGNDDLRNRIVDAHAERLAAGTAEHDTVSKIAVEEHRKFSLGIEEAATKGKTAKMTEEAFNKLTRRQKFTESVKANWSERGLGKKALSIVGTGAGLGVIAVGTKKILRGVHLMAPAVDKETGKEIPAGMGTLVTGVGTDLVGLGVIYASLAAGGSKKILGR